MKTFLVFLNLNLVQYHLWFADIVSLRKKTVLSIISTYWWTIKLELPLGYSLKCEVSWWRNYPTLVLSKYHTYLWLEKVDNIMYYLFSYLQKFQLHILHTSCIFMRVGVIRRHLKMLNTWRVKWNSVFRNGPSKICGRQLLKNLKWCDLFKQTISLQFL